VSVNSRAWEVHYVDRIGDSCVPVVKVSLHLRDKATPFFHNEREVPYALPGKVNKELHTLESREIISKVATSDACMISVNEISIK
jgi:hypothetical protein